MVDFSFAGLFSTTYKGIPDTTSLPQSITMKHSYYIYSMLLQATLLLFFVLYFVLSVYRVIKKIKNKNFREVPEEDKKEENEPAKNDNDAKNQQQAQAKDENLIYRFDDDEQEEEENEKKEPNHEEEVQEKDGEEQKKEEEQKEPKEEVVEEDYNDYHDANQQPFIQLDEKLLFLQPFLISFIIANNLFEADIVVLCCLILMFLTYFFINIKEYLAHLRLAPLFFMIFPLVAYISYFKGDHDLTT